MSKPVLLTASGTGADMWSGYPADLARRVEDLYYFQPIYYGPGGIPATVPMGASAQSGVDMGVRLVLECEARPSRDVPDGYALCGYSQGGMVVSALLDEFRTGRLRHLNGKLMAGSTFGNPWRELDSNGGRGISDRRIVGTPDFWVDEFDPGDIYANVPNNDVGDDMTAIFKLVQLRSLADLIGIGSIMDRVMDVLRGPLSGMRSVVEAIVRGLLFFGRKPPTAPHTEYHLREVRPGVTYFEHAVAHMRAMAA
ncbi:lysin B [Mycobacterium phage Mdavu]|uniref:lysin B n=1 Tax=Mycobacterium phage Enkosi TaxID=1698709 RepID=UPI0006CE4149|nr:lysin B [Mycobacterium phage Enkosi]ALF01404.1 lysin B [Mycobacterium phage Enkosi]QGJ93312.1 lysin B [Mycobacterium phage Mdavu]UXE03189.1 lysin B [Mycobacterium phage Nikao]